MMKPEELRIGNYVKFMTDRSSWMLGKINAINPNKATIDNYNIKYCNIQPIMLNAELLITLGFKRQFTNTGWDEYSKDSIDLSLAPLNDGSYVPIISVNGKYAQIRYLHQLQNLFFMLLGKELKISIQ